MGFMGFMGCLCWLKVSGLAWDAHNLLDSGSKPLSAILRASSCAASENAVFRIQGISSWSDGIWSFQSIPNQVRTFQNMLMAQWQFSRVAFRNCGADPLSYTINSIRCWFFRCQMLPTFLYSYHMGQNHQLPKNNQNPENNRIRLSPWHHNSNNPLLGANLQWSLAVSY